MVLDYQRTLFSCSLRCRTNDYDGIEEYWVKVSERGKRKAETSFEENHVKESEAGAETLTPMLQLNLSMCRRPGIQKFPRLVFWACNPSMPTKRGLKVHARRKLITRKQISMSRRGVRVHLQFQFQHVPIHLSIFWLINLVLGVFFWTPAFDSPKKLFVPWWLPCWTRLARSALSSRNALTSMLTKLPPSSLFAWEKSQKHTHIVGQRVVAYSQTNP